MSENSIYVYEVWKQNKLMGKIKLSKLVYASYIILPIKADGTYKFKNVKLKVVPKFKEYRDGEVVFTVILDATGVSKKSLDSVLEHYAFH